jgi:hypothetical protein
MKQQIFTVEESIDILEWAIQNVSIMKIPDMKYILLNSFRTTVRKDFFKSQALLDGISICELSLVDQHLV